MHSLTSALDWG